MAETRHALALVPSALAAVAAAMRSYRAPWAVAGGWAIDLTLGEVTRDHADVDLAVLREDQMRLREHLTVRTWEYADDGALIPWEADRWLSLPVHELYATDRDGRKIELLLNERDGDDWVFRRDPRVRLPLSRAITNSPSGLPVLAPEVVLLYKSKEPRAHDEADFVAALPRLDARAREWLSSALTSCSPGHHWQSVLSAS